MPGSLGTPAHTTWLQAELERVLAFGERAASVPFGFGWLDDVGAVRADMPVQLWVTGRMTHVYSLATLLGWPGAERLVDHGIRALTGPLRDEKQGGWYTAIDASGPTDATKAGYPLCFLLLGAASAVAARRPAARELLDQALKVWEDYYWDEAAGMVRESWDQSFTKSEAYRGGNVNMHAVEAQLVIADVTGQRVWLDRAVRIAERMIHHFAAENSYRVIEHFDENWRPLREYNAEDKAHRFRAYGATPGHWIEWARLLLHLSASLTARDDTPPDWLLADAKALFAAAIRDAWAADGGQGFVYTVGWDGKPVVRQRIRWVITEAIASAAALHSATGDETYRAWYGRFWKYAADHFIDRAGGSWWQELGPDNRASPSVWTGKPDLYHLMHALLIPRLPLTPAMAPAIAAGLFDARQQVVTAHARR